MSALDQQMIDRFWQAILRHGDTIRLDALLDMLAALGLRLAVVRDDEPQSDRSELLNQVQL